MILGIKTATLVAVAYLVLTYGGGYIDKQTANLQAVGMSEPAIELVQGGLEEAGSALGTAAVFFGIAVPAVNAVRSRAPAPPAPPAKDEDERLLQAA